MTLKRKRHIIKKRIYKLIPNNSIDDIINNNYNGYKSRMDILYYIFLRLKLIKLNKNKVKSVNIVDVAIKKKNDIRLKKLKGLGI